MLSGASRHDRSEPVFLSTLLLGVGLRKIQAKTNRHVRSAESSPAARRGVRAAKHAISPGRTHNASEKSRVWSHETHGEQRNIAPRAISVPFAQPCSQAEADKGTTSRTAQNAVQSSANVNIRSPGLLGADNRGSGKGPVPCAGAEDPR